MGKKWKEAIYCNPLDRCKKAIPSPVRRTGNKRRLLALTEYHHYFPKSGDWNMFLELMAGSCVTFFNYAELYPNPYAYLNDKDTLLIKFFDIISHEDTRKQLEERLKYKWLGCERVLKPHDEMDEVALWYLRQQTTQHIDHPTLLYKDFTYWGNLLDRSRVFLWNFDYKDALYQFYCLCHNVTKTKINQGFGGFVYADPLYYHLSHSYKEKHDFQEFVDTVIHYKDDFLWFISLNDCVEVRKAFEGWYFKELVILNNTHTQSRMEVLISNRPFKWYDTSPKKFQTKTDLSNMFKPKKRTC